MKYILDHVYVAFRNGDGSIKDVPAYHVGVISDPETIEEAKAVGGNPLMILTPLQAEQLGFTPSTMLATMPADVLDVHLDEVKAEAEPKPGVIARVLQSVGFGK